jgi:hypothetical protein
MEYRAGLLQLQCLHADGAKKVLNRARWTAPREMMDSTAR